MEGSNLLAINETYDSTMFAGGFEGFALAVDKIGFFNFGYWKGIEGSVELAQINLIETLVAFFANKDGNVLDVACGKGASTKFLTKYFDAKKITAINISEKQLRLCKLVAPECDFRLMDAASLDFPDASIDNVLCIEAAFHFQTREQFLREAYRVLKPGGRLAMSDLLHDEYLMDRWKPMFPKENFLANIDELKDRLLRAGFRYVRVDDSSEHCFEPFRRYLIKMMENDPKVEPEKITKRIHTLDHHMASCMVYAIK